MLHAYISTTMQHLWCIPVSAKFTSAMVPDSCNSSFAGNVLIDVMICSIQPCDVMVATRAGIGQQCELPNKKQDLLARAQIYLGSLTGSAKLSPLQCVR